MAAGSSCDTDEKDDFGITKGKCTFQRHEVKMSLGELKCDALLTDAPHELEWPSKDGVIRLSGKVDTASAGI